MDPQKNFAGLKKKKNYPQKNFAVFYKKRSM